MDMALALEPGSALDLEMASALEPGLALDSVVEPGLALDSALELALSVSLKQRRRYKRVGGTKHIEIVWNKKAKQHYISSYWLCVLTRLTRKKRNCYEAPEYKGVLRQKK